MAFHIGKYIKFALSPERAPELNAVIGGRIYPVVVPDDDLNKTPYIWYTCEDMSEEYCKDGRVQDVDTVSVNVVSKSYEQLVDILGYVRKAIKDSITDWNDSEIREHFYIFDILMTAKEEEFDLANDTYTRTLLFDIENF